MKDNKKRNIIIVASLLVVLVVVFFIVNGKKYAVTMDYNNEVMASKKIEVKSGTTVGKIETPEREGYKFLYWTIDGKKCKDSDKITKDVKLVAVWESTKKKYTVEFNTDGGNLIEASEVIEGEKIVKPQDPVKNGFKFVGWQLNGKDYDFETPATESIKLKAVWKKAVEYTIVFNTDGGNKIESIKVSEGTKITKPSNPVKQGYDFISWQLDGKDYDFNTLITKNVTLKATWKKEADNVKKYTVQFNTDGGSNVKTQSVSENKTVIKPANPTKSGYKFVSWQLNGKDYNFNASVTKNVTLKATWKKLESYTVTFDSNGGSSVAKKTVTEGSKVVKPANPTKSGYKFVSWQLDGKNYDFAKPITKNITLKATWKVPAKYTVTFNLDGGTGNAATQTVTEGNKATKPSNPTKSGYKFAGWSWDFNKVVTSNITVKAKWTANTYIVKVSLVDSYSPDRILTVYENGSKISVSSIKYTSGILLCSGTNTVVSKSDLTGETKLLVVLKSGGTVTATIQ